MEEESLARGRELPEFRRLVGARMGSFWAEISPATSYYGAELNGGVRFVKKDFSST